MFSTLWKGAKLLVQLALVVFVCQLVYLLGYAAVMAML